MPSSTSDTPAASDNLAVAHKMFFCFQKPLNPKDDEDLILSFYFPLATTEQESRAENQTLSMGGAAATLCDFTGAIGPGAGRESDTKAKGTVVDDPRIVRLNDTVLAVLLVHLTHIQTDPMSLIFVISAHGGVPDHLMSAAITGMYNALVYYNGPLDLLANHIGTDVFLAELPCLAREIYPLLLDTVQCSNPSCFVSPIAYTNTTTSVIVTAEQLLSSIVEDPQHLCGCMFFDRTVVVNHVGDTELLGVISNRLHDVTRKARKRRKQEQQQANPMAPGYMSPSGRSDGGTPTVGDGSSPCDWGYSICQTSSERTDILPFFLPQHLYQRLLKEKQRASSQGPLPRGPQDTTIPPESFSQHPGNRSSSGSKTPLMRDSAVFPTTPLQYNPSFGYSVSPSTPPLSPQDDATPLSGLLQAGQPPSPCSSRSESPNPPETTDQDSSRSPTDRRSPPMTSSESPPIPPLRPNSAPSPGAPPFSPFMSGSDHPWIPTPKYFLKQRPQGQFVTLCVYTIRRMSITLLLSAEYLYNLRHIGALRNQLKKRLLELETRIQDSMLLTPSIRIVRSPDHTGFTPPHCCNENDLDYNDLKPFNRDRDPSADDKDETMTNGSAQSFGNKSWRRDKEEEDLAGSTSSRMMALGPFGSAPITTYSMMCFDSFDSVLHRAGAVTPSQLSMFYFCKSLHHRDDCHRVLVCGSQGYVYFRCVGSLLVYFFIKKTNQSKSGGRAEKTASEIHWLEKMELASRELYERDFGKILL